MSLSQGLSSSPESSIPVHCTLFLPWFDCFEMVLLASSLRLRSNIYFSFLTSASSAKVSF